MSKVTPWGIYWAIWAVLGFGLPESYWLFVNARNTLSENFWGWERLDRAHPFDLAEWTPLHYALGIILLTGLFWLFWHLIFGLWG